MESEKNEEHTVLQMNELFDELIDDAYEFSKDITMSIDMMPFAAAFMFIFALAFSWYSFIYIKGWHLLYKIPEAILLAIIFYLSYYVLQKSREFKKKYSTLFNLKEELDQLKES